MGQRWLDYDNLCRYRPDLIMVHILGRSDGKPAVDYTVNSEVGLPFITGPVDSDRPVNHVLPAWDLLTGQHAAHRRARRRAASATAPGRGRRSPCRWPTSPSPRWPTSASWPTWS